MLRIFVLLALLCAPGLAAAQSVKLPDKITAVPGEWIVVPAKIDGGQPRWKIADGLTEVPLGDVFAPEVVAKMTGKVLKATNPGTYTVTAWNAKGDAVSDISTCTVTIISPTPPAPPAPPPAPDPLAAAIADAYASETSTQKAFLVKELAKAHRTAAAFIAGPQITTAGGALNNLAAQIKSNPYLASGALTGIKAAVAAQLNGLKLAPGDTLTPAAKQAIVTILTASATYLEKL